ncbi:MAG: TSUP family transporter [Myxococcales bacterium]|nr:TSUP family transporter [Myxococcales bacterium]
MLLLASLGILAGLITTLSGFGGGLLLISALALLWDPLTALTLSSLALVFGNAQRLWLFRKDWDGEIAIPVVMGAIPGALAGALVASRAPSWILQVAIALMTALAILRFALPSRFCIPKRFLGLGAAGVGLLSATTGGGGFLLGPLLLSAGMTGGRYIAVGASAGTAIHTFRILGYSTTGIIDFSLLYSVALIAAAILLGNILGRNIRVRLGDARLRWIEFGTPVVCAALALAGL